MNHTQVYYNISSIDCNNNKINDVRILMLPLKIILYARKERKYYLESKMIHDSRAIKHDRIDDC